METPSRHSFTLDGSSRVFPIPSPIKGDNYCRLEVDGVIVNDRTKYDIVNNSIVFVNAADVPSGSQLDVLVVQSEEAIGQLSITTNIDIVASNIADVNTVADDITNVNTTAGSIANVNTTAGSITNVNTVATNITDVNTVASSIADVNVVEDHIANVDTVATNITDVGTVAGISANVTTVAGIDSDVTTVAGNNANVTTVAGISGNVTTVAGIDTDVTTVSGISTKVTAVADNATNVNKVAAIDTDVTTVAGIDTSVTTVANNDTNVTTVAGISANVTKVANIDDKVTTVANNDTNVTSVADNMTGLNTIVTNMTEILNADTNAATATTKASEASASAVSAAQSAASAASVLDNFDDRYLGAKTADPSVDNDGDPLVVGALYFNSTDGVMKTYTASGWLAASSASVATMAKFKFTATAGQTVFTGTDDGGDTLSMTVGSEIVTLNGIVLEAGTDYTPASGSVTLATGATAGDELNVYAFGNFQVADTVSKSLGGTFTGAVTMGGGLDVTGTATMDGLIINSGAIDSATIIQSSDSNVRLKLIDGDASNGVFLAGKGESLAFETNGNNERMRIDASGNVGIGTSSPLAKVDARDASATSTTAQTNTIARFVSNASNADSHIQISNGVDHSANIGIAGGANLYFANDGAERMRIDSAGRVTMPYQPAFQAVRNSASNLNTNQTMIFNGTHLNVGNHYNTSTGKFTAPVSGVYEFSVCMLHRYRTGNGWLNVYFMKNGAVFLGGEGRIGYSQVNQLQEQMAGGTIRTHMSAGDTMEVYLVFSSTNTDVYSGDINSFTGQLIG